VGHPREGPDGEGRTRTPRAHHEATIYS
jgi:hypothetical protein